MKNLLPIMACALLLLTAKNSVPAGDWSMLGRDATHNSVSPEKNPPMSWRIAGGTRVVAGELVGKPFEENRGIRWSTALGGEAISQPVISGNLLWAGTNSWLPDGVNREDASVLSCVDTRNGNVLYRYVSPRRSEGRMFDMPGSPIGCSPLIESDRMWFTTNRREVICMDIGPLRRGMAAPRILWKFDMIEKLSVFPHAFVMFLTRTCSPASHQDWLYIVTNNGVDETHSEVSNPRAPSLICLNKNTGKLVWEDNSPLDNILHTQLSSPLIIEVENKTQVIVPQGDGWVRSFDPAGDGNGRSKLIWEFDINPKTSVWESAGRGDRNNILAAPVYYDGHVYIASGQEPEHGDGRGRLCCIDPRGCGDISSELAVDAAGKLLPRRRKRAVWPKSEIEKAIPNRNSGLVWEFRADNPKPGDDADSSITTMHRSVSQVAIADNLLMATDTWGAVHCLDARTGQRYWSHDRLASIWATPLIVDGYVYVCDEDGLASIYRLSKDPKVAMPGGHPLTEIEMDSSIHASPIYANGTLYIATRRKLFAIRRSVAELNKQQQGAAPSPAKGSSRPARRRSGPRSAFVPTPHDVVEKMLELAEIEKTSNVYDLGSGDGRIVIAAASKFGCRATGFEIDRDLVALSRSRAATTSVREMVEIVQEDVFDVDLRPADVTTVFLLPKQLERLIPQLHELKPGSRIVSHQYQIPGIKPDKAVTLKSPDGMKHSIYLWKTPLVALKN